MYRFPKAGLTPQRCLAVGILIACAVLTEACSQPPSGTFFFGSLGLGSPRLIVGTQNTGSYQLLEYDLEGNLLRILTDSTAANSIPKGIAPFDSVSVAVAYDGGDRIDRVSLIGDSKSNLVSDTNLTGNLYNMAYDSQNERYLVIESNTIEAFTREGIRIGNPFINTTTGACILSTPRGMTIGQNGYLYVVGTGNDQLKIYDISGVTPTCVTTNASFAGTVNPVAILQHSNGQIYVATQGDDTIYTFSGDGSGTPTQIWPTDTTIINNPTALIELPDGTILVASDGTNTVERLNQDGSRVGSTPFIKDGFSGLITQMLIVGDP